MLRDQFGMPLEASQYVQDYITKHATVTGKASGAGASKRGGSVNVTFVEGSWNWGVGDGPSVVNEVGGHCVCAARDVLPAVMCLPCMLPDSHEF